MYDMFSSNLERWAKYRHAALLAEAEKAWLIKEALVHLAPRQASRTRDVRFKLKSILTVLASHVSQIVS